MNRKDLIRRAKATLIVSAVGAVVGVVAAAALNILGYWVIGLTHEPGTLMYHWKPGFFAAAGAVIGPLLAWTVLRRAPVWRVVAEPAAMAAAVTLIGVGAAPWLIPWVPVAAAGAILRLCLGQLGTPTPRFIGCRIQGCSDREISRMWWGIPANNGLQRIIGR